MILDTSAVVAIVLREASCRELAGRIEAVEHVGIGTPTLVESGIVLSARLARDAQPVLARFVENFEIEPVPFTATHWSVALQAFRQFGKGRHPASLNLGDCFSYATARVAGEPLLCVGSDFPRTDLPLA